MRSTIPIPLGAAIAKMLKDRDISKEDFAHSIGLLDEELDKLLRGETSITPDVALALEISLGAPRQFWVNLQNLYTMKLARKIRWW
jgi:addiction module HigA family antidote